MKKILAEYKSIFEKQLQEILVEFNCDIQPIFEALSYGIANGGKRIRPALCYLGAEFCGKDATYVKNLAVGIEMIHSYSLVHDDLPCMDDDNLSLRRTWFTAKVWQYLPAMRFSIWHSRLCLGIKLLIQICLKL